LIGINKKLPSILGL